MRTSAEISKTGIRSTRHFTDPKNYPPGGHLLCHYSSYPSIDDGRVDRLFENCLTYRTADVGGITLLLGYYDYYYYKFPPVRGGEGER